MAAQNRVSTPAMPGGAESDKDLLAQLRAGNAAAYETMVREYGGRLLAVARRLLGNEADARDAVQDAFLSAFRGIANFSGESRIATWLHRIVVNAALMKLRSRRAKPEQPIEPLLPTFLDDGHHVRPAREWTEPAEIALQRRETRELVRESISKLPEGYRVVLTLRDIEGLDTEETARAMGLAANAVKTRLHRARMALRTLLDPHLRHEDP